MASRYDQQDISLNASSRYKRLFQKRRVKFIEQYPTQDLRHLTVKEMMSLNMTDHIWKSGDRFYKLAHQYYEDPELWWVIAWFNRTPTDSHVKIGTVITIPTPLETILNYYGV